jgi:hypothetical protein
MNRCLEILMPVSMPASAASHLLDVGVASAATGNDTGTVTVSPTTAVAGSSTNAFTVTYALTTNFTLASASGAAITLAAPADVRTALGPLNNFPCRRMRRFGRRVRWTTVKNAHDLGQ